MYLDITKTALWKKLRGVLASLLEGFGSMKVEIQELQKPLVCLGITGGLVGVGDRYLWSVEALQVVEFQQFSFSAFFKWINTLERKTYSGKFLCSVSEDTKG